MNFFDSFRSVISSIDWENVKNKTGNALKIAFLIMELAIAFALIIANVIYNNRNNIKNSIIKIVAFFIVASVATIYYTNKFIDGIVWIYQQVLLISYKSANDVRNQPIAILAPITAVIVNVYQYTSLLIKYVYKYNVEAITI